MSANESPTVQNLTQPHAPEHCKRAERLILLIRALQLLSSGLNLASQQLQSGGLKPSNTVKNGKFNGTALDKPKFNSSNYFSVLSRMNTKYRQTLAESKKLNATGLLQKATANHITADKILYDHAIQMVRITTRPIAAMNSFRLLSFSVRRQLLMSFSEIPKSASIDTNRHKSYSTRWPRSVHIQTTKCC
jgi:hypothetical protein